MNDTEFAAYNIVNQIADFYSERIGKSADWVKVRQASNDELWAFAEKIIEKLVAGVRAHQAEDPEVIELARLIEEAIAQNERINAGGTSHYIEIPTALARLAASSLRNRRAVALTPTTEETEQ